LQLLPLRLLLLLGYTVTLLQSLLGFLMRLQTSFIMHGHG
jgi:hypothetical protein